MTKPLRIWWARPRKLCAMERPGGGGRSHRPERRAADLAYLRDHGVRTVVSVMTTRHNLAHYELAGIAWHHVPVEDCAGAARELDEVVALLARETRGRGAVALHGNRHTDFVAAVCAAHLHSARGIDPREGLARAAQAGLDVTPPACALLGVDYGEVQPLAAMAASTSSGRSVTT